MTDMDYAEVYERLMDAEEALTRVRALLNHDPTHIKARALRAALNPPLYGVRDNGLPHRADMKTGDMRQPCWHEYAAHEGPCVPTDRFHEHDAEGCLDCDCLSSPMNSADCTCPEWAR